MILIKNQNKAIKTNVYSFSLQVEYNGVAVGGTPFYCKVYDSESVAVSDIPKSTVGKTVTFAGKLPPFTLKTYLDF